ncbi:MAG: hypothetical protein R3E01_25495 [Pirellulaceae bacterium]|nr:DUF4185 domain-containing protein [Planctomycetales bacterium]
MPLVPRDAYWAWGLYDSLIVVVPSLDMVVVRGGEGGKQWPRDAEADHYEVLRPFLEPLVAAALGHTGEPPYPHSDLIGSVQWAPKDEIVRMAEGCDNWPITWGDDDLLYTAYGDGWGFEPHVEHKLSLGLATIAGQPTLLSGSNLRSPTIEQVGQGREGKKASGMLMIDGVLYLLVRNCDNSQLVWSTDHGVTWKSCDWTWSESFGCPTFLNFGKNYAGARDEFVYIYSPDSDNAYDAADRMLLARAHKHRLLDEDAYDYFAGLSSEGEPSWSKSIARRSTVFEHAGRCYRGSVSYNAGIGRFLYCQVLPQSRDARGPRYEGGFGIYESPEPWGPWRTVYFTEHWDVGPGESSSLPTKWMSADGTSMYLVFSGDDCLSVRKLMIDLKR